MSGKPQKKTICVHMTSLGCPKNLVDSEIMAGFIVKAGMGISSDPESADIMLINSCAFIESARRETEEHIRGALEWRRRRRGRKVLLCGCLNQLKGHHDATGLLDEIDLRMGIDEVEAIALRIRSLFDGESSELDIGKSPSYLPGSSTPRLQLTPGHYAYVKIADGCSNFCTYCSIPGIRGRFRSRRPDDIAIEVSSLLRNGCREIILIAQDSTNYGADIEPRPDIAALLRTLDRLDSPGDFWLRLMYCHPRHFTGELVALFDEARHLLPYVDLPLQHISERILKAMNRGADAAATRNLVASLRGLRRKPAIRTTFICGFPGETEEDFAELLQFVEETRFDRLGVFSYSPEPGTAAEKLRDRVPAKIAEERREAILRTQRRISLEKNRSLIGSLLPVIVDGSISASRYAARTMHDAPEIDNDVRISTKKRLAAGTLLDARVKNASAYSLVAELP